MKIKQWIGIAIIVGASPLLLFATENIMSECKMAGTSQIIETGGHLPTCGDGTTMRALYILIFVLIAFVSYMFFLRK